MVPDLLSFIAFILLAYLGMRVLEWVSAFLHEKVDQLFLKMAGDSSRNTSDDKLSLPGLQEDCLLEILSYLDFRTRSILRVNKKLDTFLSSNKVRNKLDSMVIMVGQPLFMVAVRTEVQQRPLKMLHDTDDIVVLEKILKRCATNTRIGTIEFKWHETFPYQFANPLLDSLCQISCSMLHIKHPFDLSFAHLVGFATNMRVVNIEHVPTSITAIDLCNLRKLLLNDDKLKLEGFSVLVMKTVEKEFMKECYGITIDEDVNNKPRPSVVFRREDESLEMYHCDFCNNSPAEITHTEGKLRTGISRKHREAHSKIIFMKSDAENKLSEMEELFRRRVKFNHFYM